MLRGDASINIEIVRPILAVKHENATEIGKQTLATKHPQTHLCLAALLRDTKRRNKPRMRVVPRRPSASIQAHTQARLPFTQPTMQLSFKFQSRNLRGLAISLQELSAGFAIVTHAASSRTIGHEPAASGLGIRFVIVLFESIVGTIVVGRRCTDRETCGGWRGDQPSNACRRSIANLRCRLRKSAPIEEVTCMLARV